LLQSDHTGTSYQTMTTDSLPLQGNKHIGSKVKHKYACTTMSEVA